MYDTDNMDAVDELQDPMDRISNPAFRHYIETNCKYNFYERSWRINSDYAKIVRNSKVKQLPCSKDIDLHSVKITILPSFTEKDFNEREEKKKKKCK